MISWSVGWRRVREAGCSSTSPAARSLPIGLASVKRNTHSPNGTSASSPTGRRCKSQPRKSNNSSTTWLRPRSRSANAVIRATLSEATTVWTAPPHARRRPSAASRSRISATIGTRSKPPSATPAASTALTTPPSLSGSSSARTMTARACGAAPSRGRRRVPGPPTDHQTTAMKIVGRRTHILSELDRFAVREHNDGVGSPPSVGQRQLLDHHGQPRRRTQDHRVTCLDDRAPTPPHRFDPLLDAVRDEPVEGCRRSGSRRW